MTAAVTDSSDRRSEEVGDKANRTQQQHHQQLPTSTTTTRNTTRMRRLPTGDDDAEDDAAEDAAEDAATATSLSELTRAFEADGYLALSSLLTPEFAKRLRDECMGIFKGVLELLRARGEIDFEESHRKCPPDDECGNIEKVKTTDGANGASSKYEYPLGVGLKNGYRELVMRSPGRYELALLLDGDSRGIFEGTGRGSDAEYDLNQLLSAELLRRARERAMQHSLQNSSPSPVKTAEAITLTESESFDENGAHDESRLEQLLEWVQSNSESHNGKGCSQQHGEYSIDQQNVRAFMKLVGAIFPRESDDNDSTAHDANDGGDTGDGRSSDGRKRNDYYLCNLSLLVATPGCPTQSWHADGGHASVSAHLPCHVFNLFVPLVDVPPRMGPTELRPGTHFHTRNLGPMMLAARARKTLRPPAAPELGMGDGLLFDYRILHRGRANASDVAAAADADADTDPRNNNDEDDDPRGKGGEKGSCAATGGRDRPVLVLTFARGWFKDVCNFPKNSLFGAGEERG